MDKIYNNLNVDNLMKTDCFNQFSNAQRKEIRLGLEKGLDISWYAKRNFKANQMEEIRLGLEKNLDVSIYAKPEYTFLQM